MAIFRDIWSNFALKKVLFCLYQNVTFGHSSVKKNIILKKSVSTIYANFLFIDC